MATVFIELLQRAQSVTNSGGDEKPPARKRQSHETGLKLLTEPRVPKEFPATALNSRAW